MYLYLIIPLDPMNVYNNFHFKKKIASSFNIKSLNVLVYLHTKKNTFIVNHFASLNQLQGNFLETASSKNSELMSQEPIKEKF